MTPGPHDSLALCITRREKDRAVVCRVAEWTPPFAAPAVAAEVVSVLNEYNLTTVTGDAFSGQTWPSVLKDNGLASYNVADKSKSDIFHDLLPLLNGQLVELPDRKAGIVQERAISQLPPERVAKDVEPSQTARTCGDAAERTTRSPVRQRGMRQRTREVCVTHSRAIGVRLW